MQSALTSLNSDAAVGGNNPLKKLKAVYKRKIELYIQVVEQRSDKLSARDRKKVEALIIMEEHNREVIDMLAANKTITPTSF